VPVGVDVQVGVADQAGHHRRVDERDDGVVGPREDQGGLPEQWEERQAGPAEARGQLVEISPPGGGPVGCQVPDEFGVLAQPPAVDLPGDRAGVGGVVMPPGGAIRSSTRGAAGTITVPVAVATSTR
jgi:hypothetical protein